MAGERWNDAGLDEEALKLDWKAVKLHVKCSRVAKAK